jgi:hypothetical protein
MTNNNLTVDSRTSENKDLVLKFADSISFREAKLLKVHFHRSDHGRGPANEEFSIAFVGVTEVVLDMLFGDETNTSLPVGRGVVEDVIDLETVGVELDKLVQIFFEQDILVVDVGIDETDFSRVSGVAENSADDLEHGGDTSTSSNHAYMFAETRGIDEVALWALEAHRVTDFESGHDTRDISFFVGLDEEIEKPGVIVAADWGVAASNKFAVDVGRDGDVLANGEAKYVECAGELEAVNGSVGRDLYLLLEGELLPLCGVKCKNG